MLGTIAVLSSVIIDITTRDSAQAYFPELISSMLLQLMGVCWGRGFEIYLVGVCCVIDLPIQDSTKRIKKKKKRKEKMKSSNSSEVVQRSFIKWEEITSRNKTSV